jgi:uncharacterized protein YyaL (SSP411 family)
VDRRVYAAWNCGLAIAYLRADLTLGRPELRERARTLLERLFTDLGTPEGDLRHTVDGGGQLGDQVWGLWAATRAAAAGLGDEWRERALALAGRLEAAYADPELGGYFDHEGGDRLGRLEERVKPLPDNAVAAIALSELDALLGDPELGLRRRAARALESVAALPPRYGIMAAVFARALDRVLREPVKLTTLDPELARSLLAAYPYAVIERSGDDRAVLCIGTTCLQPTRSAEELTRAVGVLTTVRG